LNPLQQFNKQYQRLAS